MAHPAFGHRHEAGAVMRPITPARRLRYRSENRRDSPSAVAALGASSRTFACASFSQQLPDWIMTRPPLPQRRCRNHDENARPR